MNSFFSDPQPSGKKPGALKELFSDNTCAGAPTNSFREWRYDSKYVFWGMHPVPIKDAKRHFLVVGRVGSGKTVTIRILLRSIVPRLRKGKERLVLYDPKRDMLPILAGMGWKPNDKNLWVLNPFDKRSVPWDMAGDIHSPSDAEYLATLMVPPEPGSNAPFWPNSGRAIVSAVILGLMKKRPGEWTLRDLLLSLSSKERVRDIAKNSEWGYTKAAQYLEDEKHIHTIMSTIASSAQRFDIVAALWHNTPGKRRFRVREFMQKSGIAILGYHPRYNPCLAPINAMLVKVFSDHMLSGEEVELPQNWVLLDEFRWLGRLDGIEQLLNQGRSKGVSVTIGTQSIEALQEHECYGQQKTESIVGQCANVVFLQLSPQSAEWAQRYFGSVRAYEETQSMPDDGTTTRQFSRSLQERSLFLTSTFVGMPTPDSGRFGAICDIPSAGGVVLVERDFEQVKRWMGKTADIPGIIERVDVKDQCFPLWTKEEALLFCGLSDPDAEVSRRPGKSPDSDDDDGDDISNVRRRY